MDRELTALQGRIDDLDSQRTSSRIEGETARAELDRRIGEVRQEITAIAANQDVVIRAPGDGMVSAVLVSPGQQVQPDAPLMSIVPSDARLEAQLLVPSNAIGFVTTGQPVALRYAAFPYQRFGHYEGEVASIARSLLLPGEARLPMTLQEPAYLVRVVLGGQAVTAYGRDFPLQAGMALDADIVLDRRSIIEWVFDPLLSLVKRS
jgi:membrane fusion protein